MTKIYADWINPKSCTRHSYWINCKTEQEVSEALKRIKYLAEEHETDLSITPGQWKNPGKKIERLPMR